LLNDPLFLLPLPSAQRHSGINFAPLKKKINNIRLSFI
jgi:hypothetical protein